MSSQDKRLTDLDSVTPAVGDYLYIVDVSDTTDSPEGTSKKALFEDTKDIGNVLRYGADPTGVTSSRAAFDAAFEAVSAAGGGMVYAPAGTYMITTKGVVGKAGVGLCGDGWSTVLLSYGGGEGFVSWQNAEASNVTVRDVAIDMQAAGDFAACLEFDSTTGTSENVEVYNCKLYDSNKATSGNWTLTGVVSRGVDNVTVRNNYFDGTQAKLAGTTRDTENLVFQNNLSIDATAVGVSAVVHSDTTLNNVLVDGNIFINPKRGCIFLGKDGTGYTNVTTHNIVATNNICIHGDNLASERAVINIRGGDTNSGIVVSGNSIRGYENTSVSPSVLTSHGVSVPATTGAVVTGNAFTGFFDTQCVYAENAVAVNISGNTFNADTNRAIDATSASGVISGNSIYGAGLYRSSFELFDANGLLVVDNVFIDCLVAAFNGIFALDSTSGETTSATIRGNVILDSGGYTLHALRCLNNGSADIIVEDNDFREVTSNVIEANSDVADFGTIRRNLGFSTTATGTGSITSGSTTDVITHGLDITPVAANIQITLTENPTNTPGAIWVDTIGATQFTVNCENDPGASNLDFSWRVSE